MGWTMSRRGRLGTFRSESSCAVASLATANPVIVVSDCKIPPSCSFPRKTVNTDHCLRVMEVKSLSQQLLSYFSNVTELATNAVSHSPSDLTWR
jgi:hypothetical protein